MINAIDRRLVEWIESQLGQGTAKLGAPPGGGESPGVRLHLFDLAQEPVGRGTNKPPLRAALRYLVTVTDPDPAQAHARLWELLVRAVERSGTAPTTDAPGPGADTGAADGLPEWTVESDPLPLTLWTAIGVPPQPAFVLRVRHEHHWPRRDVGLVREPMTVDASPIAAGAVRGRVVGPNDQPVVAAVIDVPGLGLTTLTATDGSFRFPRGPTGKWRPRVVGVKAKSGRRREFAVPPDDRDLHVQLTLDDFR